MEARPHVALSFVSDVTAAACLYDTGAQTSVMKPHVFEAARAAGAILRRAEGPPLDLSAANTTPMRTSGSFVIRSFILGKPIDAVWTVSDDGLASSAICGMNIIKQEGLAFSPCPPYVFRLPASTAAEKWETAKLTSTKQIYLPPGSAKLASLRAHCPITQTPVPPFAEILATVDGLPHLLRADANGVFHIHMRNPGATGRMISRSETVGTAEPLSALEFVSSVEAVAAISAFCAAPSRATYAEVASCAAPHTTESSKWPRSQAEREIRTWLRTIVSRAAIESMVPEIVDLLMEFRDCVSTSAHDLGKANFIEHKIELRSHEPIFCKQFPLPAEHADVIRANIADWLRLGVIERTRSPYNSPIFCVVKRDGSYRTVLDFRAINRSTIPSQYAMRTADELLTQIGRSGAKIFSCLDLTSGFHQMKLQEESRKFTAFTVPGDAQYCWKVAPMGLSQCPATFSRLMDETFSGLECCATYFDDLAVFSAQPESHVKHLRECLIRLRRAGLKINPSKCVFAAEEVEYLGHTINADGVRPGQDKTKAIKSCTPPTSVATVRSFIGLCNYFRRFVPSFASVASPLYALTSSKTEWRGGDLPPAALQAFLSLRSALASAPILAYPQRKGKFHLFVDAASGSASDSEAPAGLGACLLQTQQDGSRRVVAYASRTLLDHERNYSAFLLELAAAVYGIDQFYLLLRGRPFILYTDHKPLEALPTRQEKTLHRLQEKLLEHQFEIRYAPGPRNIADFLSRSATTVAPVQETPATWRKLQLNDPECGPLLRAVEGKAPFPPNCHMRRYFTTKNGVLGIRLPPRRGFVETNSFKLVPPKVCRPLILREGHSARVAGHGGIFRTHNRLRELYWWPYISEDIAEHIKACDVCQRAEEPKPASRAAMQITPAQRPGERAHVDLWGPCRTTAGPTKYVCVITDAFTKMVHLSVLPDKSAEAVADAVLNYVCTYGCPSIFVSDRGKEFCNQVVQLMWTKLGAEHRRTSGYHPSTNGAAERFNRQMAAYLRRVIIENELRTSDWTAFIPALAFCSNTATHRVTRTSPFFALFGYNPLLPNWQDGPMRPQAADRLDRADRITATARLFDGSADTADFAPPSEHQLRQHRLNQQQIRNTVRLNLASEIRRTTTSPSSEEQRKMELQNGDPIYIRARFARSSVPKLDPFWVPATLLEVMPNHVVRVRPEQRGKKTPKTKIISADDIKPRVVLPIRAASPGQQGEEVEDSAGDAQHHALRPINRQSKKGSYAHKQNKQADDSRSAPPGDLLASTDETSPQEPRRSGRSRRPPARLEAIALSEDTIPLLHQFFVWARNHNQVFTPTLLLPAAQLQMQQPVSERERTGQQTAAPTDVQPAVRERADTEAEAITPEAAATPAHEAVADGWTSWDSASEEEDFFTPPLHRQRQAEETPSPRLPALSPSAYASPFSPAPPGSRGRPRQHDGLRRNATPREQPPRAAKSAKRVRFSPSEAAARPQHAHASAGRRRAHDGAGESEPSAAARSARSSRGTWRWPNWGLDFAPPHLARVDRSDRDTRSRQSPGDKS
jgi:hypothetical protein